MRHERRDIKDDEFRCGKIGDMRDNIKDDTQDKICEMRHEK